MTTTGRICGPTSGTRPARPSRSPPTWCACGITPLEGHGHRVDFVSAATGKRAIPYGLNGVVLACKILEEGEAVPAAGEELTETELMTSSPQVKDYAPNLAGSRAAYSAAWQNEKGEKGPFSDVQVHIIP